MTALVDTHCHLDGFARRGELPGVLDRARAAGVETLVAIGTEPEDWELHGRLAKEHPGTIFHTAGIHPCTVGENWRSWFDQLVRCWEGDRVPRPVALGECGLDRFHLPKDPAEAERVFARQKEAFEAQLALAKTLNCPIVVHSRQAFRESVGAIKVSGVDFTKVVFHCFSEGPAEIAELNGLGGRGSFTGILTYKTAEPIRQAAKVQGLSRCMVETDAPYLAPVPHRGKPCEPAYVRHTAEFAAALFGMPLEEFGQKSSDNARAFFAFTT